MKFESGVPPNVVYIIVDDLNTWLGAYGERHAARTPHLDRLAATGAFYRRAYCAAPYCNASRQSLFTGLRPTRTGIYQDEPLAEAPFRTMQQAFRDSGYRTFSAGKVFHGVFDYGEEVVTGNGRAKWNNLSNRHGYWDECSEPAFEPLPDGRPHHSLFGDQPRSAWPSIYRHFDWAPFSSGDAPDERTTQLAIDFLDRDHQTPFLSCIGLYRPHLPWFAPGQYFDLYPLNDIVLPVVKPDDLHDVPPIGVEFALWPFDHDLVVNSGLWRSAVRAYMACISYCDSLIGRILYALDRSAYRDNTIVVLVSDNGFHHGPKLHWSKFALWEEATRVPLIMRGPGIPTLTVDQPVSLLDVLPTLLSRTGVAWDGPLDGDPLPMLPRGQSTSRSPVITTWKQGNHSLREMAWRYTRYSDGTDELYDHRTDPFEWHNQTDNPRYTSAKSALGRRLDQAFER